MITKEELSKMTAIEKAAEYIYGSELDFCQCCADYEACNAEMNELYEQNENNPNYIPPTPPKDVCVSNIVKYFENEPD